MISMAPVSMDNAVPSIQEASGRAECRICDTTIARGVPALRFIRDVFNNRSVSYGWVHLECFEKKVLKGDVDG